MNHLFITAVFTSVGALLVLPMVVILFGAFAQAMPTLP